MYHIRIRCDSTNIRDLTTPDVARAVLKTVAFYHQRQNWYARLFLLMPDHSHALISFPPDKKMSLVVGKWKEYNNRSNGIFWQTDFFDHRIRNDSEFEEKAVYIRNNPVAKGLCAEPTDWPWMLDLNKVDQWL